MHSSTYTSQSDRVARLRDWLVHRNNPTAEITAAEVATAIGSRRHAASAIAEGLAAGILQRVNERIFPILESAIPRVEAAGQVVASPQLNPLRAAPPKRHDQQLRHAESDGKTGPAPVTDLRAVQEEMILGRRFQNRFNADSRVADGDSRIAVSSDSRIAGIGVSEAFSVDSRIAGGVSESSLLEEKRMTEETSDQILQNSEEDQNQIRNQITPRAHVRTRSKPLAKSEMLRTSVRQIVQGNTVSVALGTEVSHLKIYGMAKAYESALGTYLHRPTLRYVKGRVAPGQPNYRNWARAVAVADALNMDYDLFVKAQFWAFDAWYSRAPKPQELGSTHSEKSAAVRAQMFMAEVSAGKVNPQRPILGKQRSIADTTSSRGRRQAAAHVSRNVKFEYAEKQLKAFMRNYGATEEQVLRMFCKGPNAALYFDLEWLRQNKTYQRLQAAGEL